jgi:hypothetical protein
MPSLKIESPGSVCSIGRQNGFFGAERGARISRLETGAGGERIFTLVAALIDTNVLVYRFDGRFPEKQKIAAEILRRGIAEDSMRVPHQAIVEFIAVVTRTIRGHVILKQPDALREADLSDITVFMTTQFTVTDEPSS